MRGVVGSCHIWLLSEGQRCNRRDLIYGWTPSTQLGAFPIVSASEMWPNGYPSSQSLTYICTARPICLVLERQEIALAFSRACENTGNRIAARIAIIAM